MNESEILSADFRQALEEVCLKYGVTDFKFCCVSEGGDFHDYHCVNKRHPANWQAAYEKRNAKQAEWNAKFGQLNPK